MKSYPGFPELRIAAAPFAGKSILDVSRDDIEAGKELPAADLVICVDAFSRRQTAQEYHQLAATLIASTRERLIVGGGFYEGLNATLANSGAFSEILKVGTRPDLDIFVADRRPTGKATHAHDVPPDVFYAMLPYVARKDLLLMAMDASRGSFGFFNKTSIRMVEYPWMYEKLSGLATGASVLDIGAGVSPLPLMLANVGAKVDCVDGHSRILDVAKREEWSGWGFLNYAQFHSAIRSFHSDIMEFKPDRQYDAIYSTSVIEHMPRQVWEGTLDRAAAWLKSGGIMLLTLDLAPGTNHLWNRSEGLLVDPEGTHGTIDDLTERIGALHFSIVDQFVLRAIPHSRTDVVFIAAQK